jgi:hypothetical protein
MVLVKAELRGALLRLLLLRLEREPQLRLESEPQHLFRSISPLDAPLLKHIVNCVGY